MCFGCNFVEHATSVTYKVSFLHKYLVQSAKKPLDVTSYISYLVLLKEYLPYLYI